MRILLAEDDALLGDGLRAGLRQQGFLVDWVREGPGAEREIASNVYDAVVLDLGLPGKDGKDVLASVRKSGHTLPILILTARDAVPDRISNLDLGADDYVVKPVDLFELGARLRALVRRVHGQPEDVICMHGVVLKPATREVSFNQEPVQLSAREYSLLHTLMLSAGRVLTRDQLEAHIYSWGQEVESNAIEYHVHHLRRKLYPGLVETLRGVGYMIPRADKSAR